MVALQEEYLCGQIPPRRRQQQLPPRFHRILRSERGTQTVQLNGDIFALDLDEVPARADFLSEFRRLVWLYEKRG
jgi:hypothetical protein